MKLIFYELKKVLNKKIFLIVFVLCLALNGFLLYISQSTDENSLRLEYSDEYCAMLNEYSSLPNYEAEKKVKDELLAYEISSRFDMLAQADSEELIEMYSSELEEYQKNNPEAYKKAVEMDEQGEELFWKEQFLYDISQQLKYIKSYPGFIDEMYERAEQQSEISIFGDSDSFSYKNLYKTADNYSYLKNTELKIVNSDAFNATAEYSLTDIFVMAIVFLACVYIFGFEREKGLYSLVRCTKHGRLNTIISKLAVLLIFSAIISVIFNFSNYMINVNLYGSTDLSVNVHSISEFRNCIFSVTTGQFLMLFTLSKVLGVFVISSLFALVFICFKSTLAMYVTGLGIVGAEYLLYMLIGQNSVYNYLKYINFFYILDGGEFFGNYLNLNIFSNAVTAYPITLVFFGFVFIICLVISCVVFCIRNQQKRENAFSRLFQKFKSKFFRINGSTSVFKGEIFKFTVQNKMAVLLILLVLYAVVSSFGTVRYPYIEASDVDYKSYMEYLEGDITPEKEQYIFEQQEYFEGLQNRIAEISESTELSENTKQAMIKSIENILDSKGVALERVKAQYSRLLELQNNGTKARFIDENIYSDFVSSPTREWNSFALLCLVLIIAVPFVFSTEYKNRMIDLIRPTKNGKKYIFVRKIAIMLTFTFISFISCYLPYLIRFINTYGTGSFVTSTVCIYSNLQSSAFSVLSAMLFNLFGYMLLSFAVASIVTALSVITRNNMFTMVFSTVLILIPCLVLYSADNIRIGQCIENNNVTALIAVCTISLIILFIMLTVTEKIFTNSTFSKN